MTVRHVPGSLAVEVVDDGRGLAACRRNGCGDRADGAGHGLVGMRERVELWGGELVGRARARRRLPGRGAAAVR